MLQWKVHCLVLELTACLQIPPTRSCLARFHQSCKRALTTRVHSPDQCHIHRHSHARPRGCFVRTSQTRHSRLHVLLLSFFQNADCRLRRLVRPSIAEPRGSCASIARPLKTTSKLAFVRNLAKTCGLGGCEVELQRRGSAAAH